VNYLSTHKKKVHRENSPLSGKFPAAPLGKIEIYEDLQFINCTFGIDSPLLAFAFAYNLC
jgi:hypothetical protein